MCMYIYIYIYNNNNNDNNNNNNIYIYIYIRNSLGCPWYVRVLESTGSVYIGFRLRAKDVFSGPIQLQPERRVCGLRIRVKEIREIIEARD